MQFIEYTQRGKHEFVIKEDEKIIREIKDRGIV